MSFGASTDNLPKPDQSLFGLDDRRGVTDEEAKPLPVIYGTPQPMAPTLLTNRFDVWFKNHDSKKAGSTKEWFCSFAGLLAQGPADKLVKILSDRKEVWPLGGAAIERSTVKNRLVLIKVTNGGHGYSPATKIICSNSAVASLIIKSGKITDVIVLTQGSEVSVGAPPTFTLASTGGGSGATFQAVVDSETYRTITIEGKGFIRWYWGTQNTEYDISLLSLSANTGRNPEGIQGENLAEEHPAYQGQCKFVAISWALGNSRTNTPNLEFIFTRTPACPWILGTTNRDGDMDAATILGEMIMNRRYGLGMEIGDTIDLENFAQASIDLQMDGLSLSPIMTAAEDMGTIVTRLMEYVNGYITTDLSGRLRIGFIRDAGCTEADPATPYFDEACLTAPPKLDPASWESTFNWVTVIFTNRDNGFKEQAMSFPNRINYEITKTPRAISLRRPWITIPSLAHTYAVSASELQGTPREGGVVRVRESKIGDLDVGGIFKLSWAHWDMCYQFCRVTEMTWSDPYAREVEIKFEKDRGFMAQRIIAPPDYSVAEPVTHTPAPPHSFKLVELPWAKEFSDDPYIAALVTRPNLKQKEFFILQMDAGGDTAGQAVLHSYNFAFSANLQADYSQAHNGTWLVELDGADVALPVSRIQGLDGQNDEWLMFIGDEILSISNAATYPVGDNKFTLTVTRERMDTKRADYLTGAQVFIISRTSLRECVFKYLRSTAVGATAQFKVQTRGLGYTLDADVCPTWDMTFDNRAPRFWKPRNLTVNTSPWYGSPTYSTGGDIAVSWTRVNREGGDGSVWNGYLQNLWYLEVYDDSDSDVPRATVRFSATATGRTFSNAELRAWLGGLETNFKLRLYAAQRYGAALLSSWKYDEALVTLV